MDSHRKALSFWQAQPARQRHWTLLAILTLACLWVAWGWILPQWVTVQQAPQRIQQLQTEWENLLGMAQRLQQQKALSAPAAPGGQPRSDGATLQTLTQMLNACGHAQLQSNQLQIDMQSCTADQVVEVAQWLDLHTTWQTQQVILEVNSSHNNAWQGVWIWER